MSYSRKLKSLNNENYENYGINMLFQPQERLPAHFFNFNNDTYPLMCHENDCAMNVFNALKILTKSEALQIADKTDVIHYDVMAEFLSHKYGVYFDLQNIYSKSDGRPKTEKIEEALDTLDMIDNKHAFIIFLTDGTNGHYALMTKNNDSLYYVDPQSNRDPIEMNDITFKTLIEPYKLIKMFMSNGYAVKHHHTHSDFIMLLNKSTTRTTTRRFKHNFNTFNFSTTKNKKRNKKYETMNQT